MLLKFCQAIAITVVLYFIAGVSRMDGAPPSGAMTRPSSTELQSPPYKQIQTTELRGYKRLFP